MSSDFWALCVWTPWAKLQQQEVSPVSAGEPGTALGCGTSFSLHPGQCPVFMVSEAPGQESSTGRLEQALGCPMQAGVMRNGGSVVRPRWMLLSGQPLM